MTPVGWVAIFDVSQQIFGAVALFISSHQGALIEEIASKF